MRLYVPAEDRHAGSHCVVLSIVCRRGEWASKMKELLKPGGLLLCGEFPLKPWPAGSKEDLSRGPPFQLSKQLYHDLLEPLGFVCISEEEVGPEDSAPVRVGYEMFSQWRAPGVE